MSHPEGPRHAGGVQALPVEEGRIAHAASRPQSTRFARGWLTVAICLIGISTGPAAFTLASIGLLAGPMEQEFGWTRTAISSAISVMMLCTALTLPLVGRLVDRFGVKQVLAPSVVILGLCLLVAPLIQTYTQFLAVYVAIGTLAVGSNSVPYMRVLASWFDRRRGLAIGIAGSGTGLGFAYVPLLIEPLVSHFGWRGGYVGLGLVMLFVTLPMVWFLLKGHPHEVGLEPDGAPLDAVARPVPNPVSQGDSLGDALRKRVFWCMTAIFIGLAFVLYGLIPHLVPMLTDRGLETAAAARIAAAFGLATFGGRILIGFLIDRHDARHIAAVFFSLSAFGLLLLALSTPTWTVLVAALLLGGSLGAEVDMLAYLTSRYFGLKCFAEIFGVLFAAVMVAMALGPVVFGAVFDSTGSYRSILMLGIPVCIAATGLVLTLHPYAERRRGAPISVT